jgi:hypothetical protein
VKIDKKIYRIIDANFNRSREGLRVCEDISRFILNSSAISRELKAVRHGVSAIIKSSPATATILLESRDAAKDVGRSFRLKTEVKRCGYADIFIASIQRVKESLRVLEEFFKLIDIELAVKLSELRFRAYEIEKKAAKRLSSVCHHR